MPKTILFRIGSDKKQKEIMDLLRWFSGGTATAGFIKLIQILGLEQAKLTDFEKKMQDGLGREIIRDKGGRR